MFEILRTLKELELKKELLRIKVIDQIYGSKLSSYLKQYTKKI